MTQNDENHEKWPLHLDPLQRVGSQPRPDIGFLASKYNYLEHVFLRLAYLPSSKNRASKVKKSMKNHEKIRSKAAELITNSAIFSRQGYF